MSNYISSIWEFDNEEKLPIHETMRWYGKLPQKLVRRLIPMYSKKNDSVLANFVGSGTVITEANIANRNSVGTDVHPLSLLINDVKINRIAPKNPEEFLSQLQTKHFGTPPKFFENQYKWFDRQSLSCVSGILTEIKQIKSYPLRKFYILALARIIRDVSKIDSRCVNHIVVDHNKKTVNVLNEFTNSVFKLIDAIKDYKGITTKSSMKTRQMDARDLKFEDNSFDFVISHPPYANAVLYYNIYSIVSNILGYDYNSIRSSDMSAGGFKTYLENMEKVLQESHRVIRPHGYEALIIGDIRKNGDILTAFPYLVESAKNIGFRLEDIFIWKLQQKAGMNVARRGNHIDHNYILIFQKNG